MKKILFVIALWCALPAHASLNVGDTLREDMGKDQHGHPVRMGELHNRVVVMTHWASWCGPCRAELPILENLQKVAGRPRLAVIAVNFHEDPDIYQRLRRALIPSPISFVYDHGGVWAKQDGVDRLPNMFLINKSGRVAFHHVGYRESELDGFVDEINQLLLEPGPTDPAQ